MQTLGIKGDGDPLVQKEAKRLLKALLPIKIKTKKGIVIRT